MKRVAKTRTISKYLLLVAIVYASSYVALFSLRYVLRNDYPLVVVEGISMQPTFYEGDLIAVKGVDNKQDIMPSDIIVFHEPYDRNKLIVHRVVQRIMSNTRVEFVTKGDNNKSYDPWLVLDGDVVGLVIGRVPFLGSIIMMIQSPTGNVFSITLIIIIIIISIFHDEYGENGKTK